MIDLIALLLLLDVTIYAFVKFFLYYKLFTSELRFPCQNQFDIAYKGDLLGYLTAMAIITWWPWNASIINSALKR
jgi:hypothetical protein